MDTSVTITCIFPSTSHIGPSTQPSAGNAFYFRNSFNSTGTTEHLSSSISKRLIILTTLVKKAFLEGETQKFAQKTEVQTKETLFY